ncbi:MAG: inorganic phosphate transporter [Planctomycetaceae bacterium]|nr:inorganic phosphate transporter [Planctomycetaceae bacterium]
MTTAIILLILVIAAALVFEYINGFHDAANAIATVVSTKVLSPRTAILYAAVLNFFGAFFGTHVAKTIGSGIVDKMAVSQEVILCALLGAIIWNLITWVFGIPSSSSHALIGGLLGAAVVHCGIGVVHISGLIWKVIVPMFASPLIGFLLGFSLMLFLLWMFAKAAPERINKHFKRLQLFSAGVMAFSHGSNDAQKTMGIITLSLLTFWMMTLGDPGPDDFCIKAVPVADAVTVNLNDFVDAEGTHTHFEKDTAYVLSAKTGSDKSIKVEFTYKNGAFVFPKESGVTVDADGSTLTLTNPLLKADAEYTIMLKAYKFAIPVWVIFTCAVTMALGTAAGGWKIIRTLGHKMIKLKPIHGFAAETTAASTILTSSFLGFPVSTTHIISTAIMGVGSTVRFSAVKWGLVGNIVLAWVLTIPVCAVTSAGLYWLFSYFSGTPA